jgi:type VI secretion system secreted protein VgrG
VDSGVNHAGYLSGIHSHNLDDGGYNQWVVDDTQAQLRMRLARSTASSQLNIGYLIAQSPTSAQRGSYRGQGFELRTDAWGMLRGAEGVLLSTTSRAGNGASVTSTQMDVQESVAQLNGAKALSDALDKAARHQTALTSKDANKAQVDLTTAIDQQQKGHYPAPVNGQEALKAMPGSRELDAAQPVEKFDSAIVHLEAPSNINLASPASTALFAGQQIHWTTQGDMHWAAGYTMAAVSGNATTLFSNEGGIQVFAGNGPLSLQAHTDQLEILADKEITVISVNDHIVINANKKITLMAGQSSVTLEGGNITFACPGKFTVKGAQHTFDLGKLPDSRIDLFVDVPSGAVSPVSKSKMSSVIAATPLNLIRPIVKEKEIKRIYWSYGEDETPLVDVSRFYSDINVHVETLNYQAGEPVEIIISGGDEHELADGVAQITLTATVQANGNAKIMNALKDHSVEIYATT